MYTYPIERECDSNQAIDFIKLWLDDHHIQSSLHTTEDKLIATVELYNLNDKFLSRGSGKGQWAVVGAYFQVFEHMMLEHQFTTSHIEVVQLKDWLSSNQCHSQCLFGQALTEHQDGLLKCSCYHSLLSLNTYLVPEVLMNPFYIETLQPNDAYCFLNRYTSNSGWASGSSFEETILHGANEVIEHHCLSELYKQYLGFTEYSGEFYRVIPPSELLDKYKLSPHDIEDLFVIMSRTLFDSYFCACVIPYTSSPMAFRSSGVSYSEFHAIERALSELSQVIENYDEDEFSREIEVAEFLNKHDKLGQISDLSKLDRLPLLDVSYLKQDSMNFKVHYQSLFNSIKAAGYDLLVHTAFNQEKLWLTSTYIPGLERFNVIDKGKWVVPLKGK